MTFKALRVRRETTNAALIPTENCVHFADLVMYKSRVNLRRKVCLSIS